VVYALYDSQQRPSVVLRAYLSGTSSPVSGGMWSSPRYLAPSVILVAENGPNQGLGGPYSPDGKSYAIDLETSLKTLMPFGGVADVWPGL
jgi:hypothetical protein